MESTTLPFEIWRYIGTFVSDNDIVESCTGGIFDAIRAGHRDRHANLSNTSYELLVYTPRLILVNMYIRGEFSLITGNVTEVSKLVQYVTDEQWRQKVACHQDFERFVDVISGISLISILPLKVEYRLYRSIDYILGDRKEEYRVEIVGERPFVRIFRHNNVTPLITIMPCNKFGNACDRPLRINHVTSSGAIDPDILSRIHELIQIYT